MSVIWLCLKSESISKRLDHCLAMSTLNTSYILKFSGFCAAKFSLNDYFWSKIPLYLVIWSWNIRRRVSSSTRCALAEVIFLFFPIVMLSRISCIFLTSLSCQKSISHSFSSFASSCKTGFWTVSKQRHPRIKCYMVSSLSLHSKQVGSVLVLYIRILLLCSIYICTILWAIWVSQKVWKCLYQYGIWP